MVQCKGKIFRIAGVSGCGKTTVTGILDKMAEEEGEKFLIPVNTRLIKCKLAGVENEMLYRKIPEQKRRELFPHIIRRISETADSNQKVICYFERHLCSMDEEDKIIARGIPPEHGERTVGLALILTHEKQVAAWRRKDLPPRQDRHLLQQEQIAEEQIREIELALAESRKWGFPVHMFFNRTGRCERVAAEIYHFTKG